MTISSGIILIMLAPGVLICKKKWIKIYPVLLTFGVLIYHFFLPDTGSLQTNFLGFRLNLFQYNQSAFILTSVFLIFGLCVLIFLWSKNKNKIYYLFALWQIGGATAVFFCGDFLSFFVFWEFVTLSSVAILLYELNLRQLKTYFLFHFFGTICFLMGIAISYSVSGQLNLDAGYNSYPFFLIALFIKGAVFPFHYWLISVYPTVNPETVVLLSAYTTKVGIFGLFLLVPDFNLQLFGSLIAVIFVLYALKQHKLTRLLAFHLISQMGYVIAAIGTNSIMGNVAAIYHLINNILYKGLLFMVAVVLIDIFGTDELLKIKGRGRRLFPLFIITGIAAASISGIPLFNGFVSKTLIKKSLTNHYAGYLLKIAGVGTALSFVKVIYYVFVCPNKEISEKKFIITQYLAMILLAFLCTILGLFPGIIVSSFDLSVHLTDPKLIWGGLWPMLTAILVFVLYFETIHRFILKITPDLSDFSQTLLTHLDNFPKKLQLLMSGNIQHYLVWLVTTLVLLWAYVFLTV